MKNICYYDTTTNRSKSGQHATFDEGMGDTPPDKLPPNARHLRKALGHHLPADDKATVPPTHLRITFSPSPFTVAKKRSFTVTCSTPVAGLIIKDLSKRRRGFISDIPPKSSASSISSWKRKVGGSKQPRA